MFVHNFKVMCPKTKKVDRACRHCAHALKKKFNTYARNVHIALPGLQKCFFLPEDCREAALSTGELYNQYFIGMFYLSQTTL